MPNNTINDFKGGFNGGTRANRFQVYGFWPNGVLSPTNTEMKIKIFASSLPSSTLGTISVPYRGRSYYLPGDRQYSVWSVDIFDDSGDRTIWRSFNKWKELLDGHESHKVSNNDYSYSSLQKTWTIDQLDLNGTIIRTLQLQKCWPSEIGSLTLDMGSTEPSIFRVTMTFDYLKFITGLNQ